MADTNHPHDPGATIHRLSLGQERKLLDYLEDHLLDITRNYKKRCVSSLPHMTPLLTPSQRAPVFHAPHPRLLPQRRPPSPRAHPADPARPAIRIAAHIACPPADGRCPELHHRLHARLPQYTPPAPPMARRARPRVARRPTRPTLGSRGTQRHRCTPS